MTLFNYFKEKLFPTSNEVDLPEAITREVNKAVENILEEEKSSGTSRRTRKYTYFTPESRAKIAKYAA